MFGVQFYPTPREVAEKMVEPYLDLLKSGAVVLDPSAGRGDLLNHAFYKSKQDRKARGLKYLAVEIDPQLQAIIKDAGFKLVGENWLEYTNQYHVDIILMNPPFADGSEHLLLAWERLRSGHICCLLNGETIRNPHTIERELLARIIADNGGTVEFLGNCFANADRATNVEVAMVRLHKKGDQAFKFDRLKAGAEFDFEHISNNGVAKRDVIESLLLTYSEVADALRAHITAEIRFNTIVTDLIAGSLHSTQEAEEIAYAKDPRDKYNMTIDFVRRGAWRQIFERTEMRSLMTERVKKDFDQWNAQQGTTDFNRQNILAFFDMILINRKKILHECIVDVFDMMTRYDEKNKVYREGWKTNDSYKVNKKVILPNFVSCDHYYHRTLSANYRRHDTMNDIDRAMCLISGTDFNSIDNYDTGTTLYHSLKRAIKENGVSNPGEGASEFFTFRYFIKGTLHIVFKDEYVWAEFNRRAAAGKGWLGDG